MSRPILVKNLLNLLAIWVGSAINFPSTLNFSIGDCSFFPVVNFLRMSHVFLGFLYYVQY